MLMLCLCGLGTAYGQDVSNVDAEDADGKEPLSPTFVPMVKVSKALVGGDSIQYVELNALYIYPKQVFTDPANARHTTALWQTSRRCCL